MSNNKKHRALFGFLFFIYLIFMVYFLFLSDDRCVLSTYRYNLTPFKEIRRFIYYRDRIGTFSFVANIVGNFVAFIPFGYLLPKVIRKDKGFLMVTFSCLMFTLVIETVQLITKLGRFDVDDIMMNTVGGVIGYILHRIYMRRKKKNAFKG